MRRRSADGLWEARREAGIAADGRRLQIYAYGKTKTEALEKLARKLSSGVRAGASNPTLAEYLAGWLAEVQLQNAYATYALRETTCRKHVLPYIGGVKLCNVCRHTTSQTCFYAFSDEALGRVRCGQCIPR